MKTCNAVLRNRKTKRTRVCPNEATAHGYCERHQGVWEAIQHYISATHAAFAETTDDPDQEDR